MLGLVLTLGYLFFFSSPSDREVVQDNIDQISSDLELVSLSIYSEAVTNGQVVSESAFETVTQTIEKDRELLRQMEEPARNLGLNTTLLQELRTQLEELERLVESKAPEDEVDDHVSRVLENLGRLEDSLSGQSDE